MKIPRRIEQAIDRRTRLAEELASACIIVDDFIKENGMDDEVADYDWLTGVEIYANPSASGERVKEAIRNHEEKGKG